MTHDEFKKWLAAHVAAFPGILEWGKRVGNWNDVKASWERVLSDVELPDATKITDSWSRGEVDPPKGFGDHARAVRIACKTIAAKRFKYTRKTIDGQPTVACRDCDDSGQLLVFHPSSMREMEGYDFQREYLLHIRRALPVLCDCEAGLLIKSSWPPRLNRKTMVPASGGIDEAFDRLSKFIEEWKVKRTENAPNYSPELAEWSR